MKIMELFLAPKPKAPAIKFKANAQHAKPYTKRVFTAPVGYNLPQDIFTRRDFMTFD